jgi:ABC-type sulfate transport system permease subunit
VTAAIIIDVWKTTPFMALLLLAGLQVIPNELYEAAGVDGSNGWQQFWTITLPMLRTALLIALMFRLLDALLYRHVNPYGRFTLDMTQRIPFSLTKLPRSITCHKTVPHLSTLRLRGLFLNAGPNSLLT